MASEIAPRALRRRQPISEALPRHSHCEAGDAFGIEKIQEAMVSFRRFGGRLIGAYARRCEWCVGPTVDIRRPGGRRPPGSDKTFE